MLHVDFQKSLPAVIQMQRQCAVPQQQLLEPVGSIGMIQYRRCDTAVPGIQSSKPVTAHLQGREWVDGLQNTEAHKDTVQA